MVEENNAAIPALVIQGEGYITHKDGSITHFTLGNNDNGSKLCIGEHGEDGAGERVQHASEYSGDN
jgi:hypothetical protein